MNIAFANPLVLWALTLLAVPVALHLFNLQRPQLVYFSSIRFLKQIESESQKTSNIKRLLLLLMRILALSFIILAFAKPYIKDETNMGLSMSESKFIYIDNSFSMGAQSSKGTCLEHAKTIARAIITSGGKNERYWICDNDMIYAGQDPTDVSRSMEAIEKIELSGKIKNISEIAAKAKWKTGGESLKLIAITDAQKISFDITEITDSLIYTTLIPVQPSNTGNISIDSCWFETPYRTSNSQEELFVKISKNNKPEQKDVSLRLFVNDSLKAVSNLEIKEGFSTKSIQYNNPATGDVRIHLEIEDYPVEFDNKYHYAYSISSEIPVLYISEQKSNPVIKAMYAGRSEIRYETIKSSAVSPSDIENFSLIIAENSMPLSEAIHAALREFVSNGGSLMIIPSPDNLNSSKTLLSETFMLTIDSAGVNAEITHIETAEEVFATALKQKNKKASSITVSNPQYFSIPDNLRYRSLLAFANKKPAFAHLNFGQGKLYISAVPLDRNNLSFIGNPIIAPLLFNPALFSRPSHSNQTCIGSATSVRIERFDNISVHIVSQNGETNFVPEYRYDRFNSSMHIMPSENIRKEGFYQLITESAQVPLAYNYDRKESQLASFTIGELEDIRATNSGFSIEEPQENTEFQFAKLQSDNKWIWIYCFIAAMFFLVAEKLTIKFL